MDMILLHTNLNSINMVPTVGHWLIALSNSMPTVSDGLAWSEQSWMNGNDLHIDLVKTSPKKQTNRGSRGSGPAIR